MKRITKAKKTIKTAPIKRRPSTLRPALAAKAFGVTAGEHRPVQPSIAPVGPLPDESKPQGSDGVQNFGGWVFTGETNYELAGANLWRELGALLANCILVATGVRMSLDLIGGADWEVVPNPRCTDQKLAERCADTVRTGLIEADMPLPWNTHVEKAALFAYYGFSLHSWYHRKREDGLTVYADIQHRPQYTIKRWDQPIEGMPWIGVEQRTRSGGLYYLERPRLWYCGDLKLTDVPQGVGILRHVHKSAARLERLEDVELYGYNANLRGVPIGKAPLGELYNEAAKLPQWKNNPDGYVAMVTAEMRSLLANHAKTPEQGFMMDSATYLQSGQNGASPTSIPKWAIDLLQGDDMGLAEIMQAIERVNREIARCMAMEFLMMGDGGGSKAMHVDKTAQYGAFLNATMRKLAAFARNDLARPLVVANHGQEAGDNATPLLRPTQISTNDIRTITGALLDMKQAGAFMPPDDPAFNMARAAMEMPPQVAITSADLTMGAGGLPAKQPRNPNDPSNPDNGGDGYAPSIPGEDGYADSTDPTDPTKPTGPSGSPPRDSVGNAPSEELRVGSQAKKRRKDRIERKAAA